MLLGPEGTAGRLLSRGRYELRCCLRVVAGLEGLRAGTARSNRSRDRHPLGVWVVWVGAGVRVPVTGRSLRTAQWTRASF